MHVLAISRHFSGSRRNFPSSVRPWFWCQMAPEPTQVFVEGRSGWILSFLVGKKVQFGVRFDFLQRIFRRSGTCPIHLEKMPWQKNPYKTHTKSMQHSYQNPCKFHTINSCRNPCTFHARVCGANHGSKSWYDICFIWVQAFAL